MTSYTEQRKCVEKLQGAARLIDSNKISPRDRILAKTLPDVIQSITQAEQLERLAREIYQCAKKNREFCLHCDSIAKVIEEFQK